jgi:hypothetical protein
LKFDPTYSFVFFAPRRACLFLPYFQNQLVHQQKDKLLSRERCRSDADLQAKYDTQGVRRAASEQVRRSQDTAEDKELFLQAFGYSRDLDNFPGQCQSPKVLGNFNVRNALNLHLRMKSI